MMTYLDLQSIETILLNVKEMNVLDNQSRYFLSSAKSGFLYLCETGKLNVIKWLYLHNDHDFLINDIDGDEYEDVTDFEIKGIKIACANGHLDLVKWLYKKIFCYDEDDDGIKYKMFLKACANNHIHIVKWLISILEKKSLYGAINSREAPLLVSCNNGHFDVVCWLLDLDTNNYYKNKYKTIFKKSFEGACINGHLNIVKILWDYQQISLDHKNIFKYVCEKGYLDVAQWLYTICNDKIELHKYIWKNDRHNTGTFRLACYKGHFDLAKWLYSICDDTEYFLRLFGPKNNIIITVCNNGHLDVAKWLFSFGYICTEIIRDVFTEICDSVKPNIEIVQWLYSLIDFVDENDKIECISRLQRNAYKNGCLNIAKWLYSLNGSYTKNMKYAFPNCCKYGNREMLSWLDSIGFVPSNNYAQTGFTKACSNGHIDIAQQIYYNPNYKNNILTSEAFIKSSANGHLDVLQWIASLKRIDNPTLEQAFVKSCSFGYIYIAKWLWSLHKPNVNIIKRAFYASFNENRKSTVKWLVQNNDFDKDTIKKYVAKFNDDDHWIIIKWIKEYCRLKSLSV